MGCNCGGGRPKVVVTSQEAEAMRKAQALSQQEAQAAAAQQRAMDAAAYERRLAEAMRQSSEVPAG